MSAEETRTPEQLLLLRTQLAQFAEGIGALRAAWIYPGMLELHLRKAEESIQRPRRYLEEYLFRERLIRERYCKPKRVATTAVDCGGTATLAEFRALYSKLKTLRSAASSILDGGVLRYKAPVADASDRLRIAMELVDDEAWIAFGAKLKEEDRTADVAAGEQQP